MDKMKSTDVTRHINDEKMSLFISVSGQLRCWSKKNSSISCSFHGELVVVLNSSVQQS